MLNQLSHNDIKFIVKSVATKRSDHERIVELVKNKPDILDVMLEEESLFHRVVDEEEILIKISPFLLFEILLRKLRRELKSRKYTYEKISSFLSVSIFDGEKLFNLLNNSNLRLYLSQMLASFTKVESGVIYIRVRDRVYKKKYSDMNIDDLIYFLPFIEGDLKIFLFKRIGDTSLFISSIFPEYCTRFGYTIADYQNIGKKYYKLVSENLTEGGEIYLILSNNFSLTRKTLNLLSRKYFSFHHKLFDI